jgi:hypothetical protein
MNQKKLNTLGLIIKVGISVIGIICCLLVIGIPNDQVEGSTVADVARNRDGFALSATTFFTFAIMAATLLVVLGFSLYSVITDFKRSMKSLIIVGGSIGLFLIMYLIGTSDNKASLRVQGDMVVTQGTVNFTHAGLIFLYIMMAIVVIVSLAAPLMGRMRK